MNLKDSIDEEEEHEDEDEDEEQLTKQLKEQTEEFLMKRRTNQRKSEYSVTCWKQVIWTMSPVYYVMT